MKNKFNSKVIVVITVAFFLFTNISLVEAMSDKNKRILKNLGYVVVGAAAFRGLQTLNHNKGLAVGDPGRMKFWGDTGKALGIMGKGVKALGKGTGYILTRPATIGAVGGAVLGWLATQGKDKRAKQTAIIAGATVGAVAGFLQGRNARLKKEQKTIRIPELPEGGIREGALSKQDQRSGEKYAKFLKKQYGKQETADSQSAYVVAQADNAPRGRRYDSAPQGYGWDHKGASDAITALEDNNIRITPKEPTRRSTLEKFILSLTTVKKK